MTEEENKSVAEEATTEAPAEEVVAETPAPAAAAPVVEEAEEVEVPAEYKELIEKIEKMTVLELHGLVKTLEKKFGVSAAAVAVAGPAGAGEAAEEKSEFTIHLAAVGDSKIGVIKAVKDVLGLGLKEAKDLVESAPVDLKSGVKAAEAEEMKAKLAESGATIELK